MSKKTESIKRVIRDIEKSEKEIKKLVDKKKC